MIKKELLSTIEGVNNTMEKSPGSIPGIYKSGLSPADRVYILLGFNDNTLYRNDIDSLNAIITTLVIKLKESISKNQEGEEMIKLGEFLLEVSKNIKLYFTPEQKKEYREMHNKFLLEKFREFINGGGIIEYRNGKETALLSIYMHIVSIIDMLIEKSELLTLQEIEFYGERLIFLGEEIININSLSNIGEKEQI